MSAVPLQLDSSADGVDRWPDALRRGVWPKSLVVWAAAFYLAFFIIRPWEQLVPELATVRFERIMVIAMILLVVAWRGIPSRISLQPVTVMLLLGAVVLSGVRALDPSLARPEVVEFLGTVISFWVLVAVARTPYQLLFLMASYLVATFLYLAKAEWEYFLHGGGRFTMGVHRLIGPDLTFGGPNEVAASCLFSLPFWLFFMRSREEFCATWPRNLRKAFRLFLWLYPFVCVSALLLTRSRSGALGLVLLILMLTTRTRGIAKKIKGVVIAVSLLAALYVLLPHDMRLRLQTIWDPDAEQLFSQGGANASTNGRWYGFVAGMRMFREYPLTGVGIGNFVEYRVNELDGVKLKAHNIPGEVLGETGIVGGIAFVLFVFAIWRNCGRITAMAAGTSDPQLRLFSSIGAACKLTLILLCFSGLSDHNLQRYTWMWVAAFAMLAFKFATDRLDEE